MSTAREKFGLRARTRVLFSIMSLLMLAAVFLRFNFHSEQMMQWLQVGLIVLMMLLGLWEIRRINRGLQNLARVADAIGHGDYSSRAPGGARDALGSLGKAINLMAERIESSIRDRDSSQAELMKSKEALDRQNEQLSNAFTRQTKFGAFLADLASIDINTLANKALEHIIDGANAQLGAFYLFDENSRHLVCLNTQGVDRKALSRIQTENALSGLPGEVFAQQKWVFVEDQEAFPEIDLGVSKVRLRCVYGIPVLFRAQTLGVIVLAGLKKPDSAQIEYLRNHLDALANGLNNALGYKAINRQSVLLEKANDELRRADQLRSEFVANMSHELRTPLNSVIGFSGILLKNRAGTLDESDLKRAEKIHRNGKHLLHLINEILDLSKIEAGRMEVNLASVKLSSLLHEVVDLLQPQADAGNLRLKLELPPIEQTIETDEQKLRQVLINLTGNAIKFTREGSVTVRLESASAAEGGTLIRVQDTGIGIAPDKLETIFEAFRQADNSTTREFGGTGLGLTISRSLVALLGGTLTAASEEGKGSTFIIKLPAQPMSPVSLPPSRNGTSQPAENGHAHSFLPGSRPSPEEHPARSDTNLVDEYREALSRSLPIKPGQRVMVVDDDADARDLICHFIQDLGAQAISCSHPGAALRKAMEERPDLITLDLMMPEKSGWELLSSFKAEPALRETPVIIISIVADRRKAISLGAVDALTKPIIRSEFNASVARHLRGDIRQKGRVLIVEDDPDAQQLFASWLECEVRELRVASNGREALELLEVFRPDIIFLDLQMPVMDGATFLERLRGDERFAGIPVIVLTAKTLPGNERRKIEAQVSRILAKGEVFTAEPQT